MTNGQNEVSQAAEKTAELIRTLGLENCSVSIGTPYLDGGHPEVNVHTCYTRDGREVHRSIHVRKYFHNPVSIYTCGWFPDGMFYKVIEPLCALGYNART